VKGNLREWGIHTVFNPVLGYTAVRSFSYALFLGFLIFFPVFTAFGTISESAARPPVLACCRDSSFAN